MDSIFKRQQSEKGVMEGSGQRPFVVEYGENWLAHDASNATPIPPEK
jgi:hypothetical protein